MQDFAKNLQSLADRGPDGVIDFVAAVIREGLRRSASDIHIEPAEGLLLTRFRLDGVLHPAVETRTACGLNIVARVKVLADLLTYQTDTPQEGRINRDRIGAPADIRASTFPTVRGEKVVLRLFDPQTRDVRIAQLGYPDAIRSELESQLLRPAGVILLTGPAGSGKTTTIYAALAHILDASGGARNIVTVEDPVERVLRGVTQTQVHPPTGLTFARCLRSLMRQDPEVILVGEIRDRETAEIAIEAGLTGHLVISTIHSGTTAGVFTRLLDMGVEPYLAASSVNYVVAQRLIRKLCPQCRRPAADLAGLPDEARGKAFDAVGCEACFGAGYRGRTVIAEALRMTKPLSDRIHQRAATEVLAVDAVESGTRPLRDAALDAILAGITSPTEIRRVLGPEAFAG